MKYSGFEKEEHFDRFSFYNGDCMDLLKQTPDKYYDLCIVDPPYGIGRDNQTSTICKNPKHNRKHFEKKSWDNEIPTKEYFNELFRISKNQIVWGANYFTEHLPKSMGWIFWDKGQDLSMSDGELAFTSFERALRRKTINRAELAKEGTIHPTEKPVNIIRYLIEKSSQPGDLVLDTFAGSFSTAKACKEIKRNFICFEIEESYCRTAKNLLQGVNASLFS